MGYTVFITGATGNIGAPLLSRLLGDAQVGRIFVLVRADSEADALGRIQRALSIATGKCDEVLLRRKVQALCGDITKPNLDLSSQALQMTASAITHIVHCAAQTEFTLPLERARQTNCLGTVHVAELARKACVQGNLQHMIHVSTAYVSGPIDGEIHEGTDLPHQFSNSYEQTKAETERWLMRECGDLPITVVRPSIVVGDSVTGRILTCNVLYTPLRWILRHRSDEPSCPPDTELDVVSVDYIANAISHLLFKKPDPKLSPIHLAAGSSRTMTVGEVVAFAQVHAAEHGYLPMQSSGKLRSHVLDAFAPYVGITRHFNTSRADSLLVTNGISPKPLHEYLAKILEYCFTTNWGKLPLEATVEDGRDNRCAA